MCNIDIPADAVILNKLTIIEYIDGDGELYKVDVSSAGDGSPLPMGKALEMAEFARVFATMPFLADMCLQYIHDDDDGEEVEV